MSELTWLAELIATHDLSPKLKKHIIKRMKAVEPKANINMPGSTLIYQPPPNLAGQAPSTIAAMQRHAQTMPIESPGVVAATPQTAMAVESRQKAIDLAMGGKLEAGRTSPRKF